MKNKKNYYLYIVLVMTGCFVLGTYSASEKEVELYRWILTSVITLVFLVHLITYKEDED